MPIQSVVSVAADVTQTTTSVNNAVETIVNLVPTVLNIISSNAVLMVFFCAGLLGVAIGVIRKLKH